MPRARPRNVRKKPYRARTAEDRCPICGNLREGGRCSNPYCKEYRPAESKKP